MTIFFKYNKKQVLQALRYHFLNRPEIRFLLILVNIFAIASAVLFYFKKISAISFFIFSVLWFLLMLVIWRILPSTIYKKSQTFANEFGMSFNDAGVELTTTRGNQFWPWQKFSGFLETPYFFHLYFDARSFFLIPKDAFNNLTIQQDVRDLLKNKIKKM